VPQLHRKTTTYKLKMVGDLKGVSYTFLLSSTIVVRIDNVQFASISKILGAKTISFALVVFTRPSGNSPPTLLHG